MRLFFQRELWSPDLHRRWARPHQRAFLHLLRTLYLALTGAGLRDRLRLQAAALTYTTLLSVVPAMAVVFSIFAAFGGLTDLRDMLHELIAQNIALSERERVLTYLNQLVATTHAGALGGVAVLLLALTAVSMLSTVEQAFSSIWGVRERRSFLKRLQRYWPVLTLGPLLLAASISVTAGLQSSAIIGRLAAWFPWAPSLISIVSFLLTCMALALAYALMPNTRVHASSALTGALAAGLLFEIAKQVYALWARQAITYSAIYGSLAFVPLTIIWIYVSWGVVLTGAILSFAFQNARTYHPDAGGDTLSARHRVRIATKLLLGLHRTFADGKGAMRLDALLTVAPNAPRAVRALLDLLTHAGLIAPVDDDGEGAFLPGRPPERTSLLDVERAVLGSLPESEQDGADPALRRISAAALASAARLEATSFAELMAADAGGAVLSDHGDDAGVAAPAAVGAEGEGSALNPKTPY